MEPTKVFVGGIPLGIATPEEVTALFVEHAGVELMEVVILPPKGSNQDTRCGFVHVEAHKVQDVCEALNGMQFEGVQMPLAVRPASSKVEQAPAARWMPDTSAFTGTAARVAPPARGVPAASQERQRAVAEGRWVDAATWREQEYARGETAAATLRRKTIALEQAVVAEHFWEAAAIAQSLAELNPQAAWEQPVAPFKWGSSPSARGPPGMVVPPKVTAQQAAAAAAQRQAAKATAQRSAPPANGMAIGAQGGWYTGSIISYMPERHFGFIGCPDLGMDCFLAEKQKGDFEIGDTVQFEVTYNQQGKPQAQNLSALGGGVGQAAAAHGGDAFDGWGAEAWDTMPAITAGIKHASTADAWDTAAQNSDEQYVGTIITFTPERHFGFISCPALGMDVFLSDKQLGSFNVGDTVAFTVTQNNQGKPQAQCLQAPPAAGPAAKRPKVS